MKAAKTMARRAAETTAGIALCLPGATATGGRRQTVAATDVIVERHREIMLMDVPPDEQTVRGYARTLGDDGSWPDIKYRSSAPSDWTPRRHLLRLRGVALAIAHPDSPLRDDPAVQAAAERALDHWLDKRYQSPPWWHNRIGTPLLMRDILVLLEPMLSEKQQAGGWEVVAQYGRVEMTGANLIWLASLAIVRAAAVGDTDTLAQAATSAAAEIKITDGEGIQSDFSFHQHGARLQSFHYGRAYAERMSELAWLLRKTPWAVPEDKVPVLADYLIEGTDWMRRGSATVPGTMDRAASRPGALGGHSLARSLRLLRDLAPSRVGRIDSILDREAGRGKPRIGFRHFPRSDFTVYHREPFSFFLKTVSARTYMTESLNAENLKGYYLNTGDGYFVRDGKEYFDLMPIWNWELLPGLTTAMDIPDGRYKRWASLGVQRKTFVGGTGDGRSGATAMDYHIVGAPEADDAPRSILTARKAWFFHDDKVVALIGDLHTLHTRNPTRTALDQSRLDGPVTVGLRKGRKIFLDDGEHALQGVTWLHHRGTAYVPLEPAPLTLILREKSDTWRTISAHAASREPVTARIFLPILEHGANPEGANVGYVMAAAASPEHAAALAARRDFDVLANNSRVQAVRFHDGLLMAVFYQADTIRHEGRMLLKADGPCVLLQRDDTVWACQPAQPRKPDILTLETGAGRVFRIRLPSDGTTVQAKHEGE